MLSQFFGYGSPANRYSPDGGAVLLLVKSGAAAFIRFS